jgi:YVTN family beta-propeller protein
VRSNRRAARRRRGTVARATGALVLALAGAAAIWSTASDGRTTAPREARPPVRFRAHRTAPTPPISRLHEDPDGQLPFAIQDAAAAALPGGGIALLGGLGATDLSLDEAIVERARVHRSLGRLPHALHDAPGVRIGAGLYVFGGGDGVTQLAGITRVDLHTGRIAPVGTLPAPSSDSAAASRAGLAYIVGGYTGSRWLDSIVAWRPGHRARIVGRLPTAVRYAAVTFAGGLLVIAGGSLPNGTASRSVLTFDPATGRVRAIGQLPTATTHAAAATIGDIAYVIGGRGPAADTPSTAIVAIDPRGGRIRRSGQLHVPRSDLTAVSTGPAIVIAGGRSRTGTLSSVALLRPVSRATRRLGALQANAVYAHDRAGMLSGPARFARPLVYVPNSQSNTVSVIDPVTYRVIDSFAVGALPQHVTPSWDLKTLYVDNDEGNSLTPINPETGQPEGAAIPVPDPYNLYFTPDGRSAIVVAERLHRLDFRDPHSFALQRSLPVPCRGVDHMDFTADGRFAVASCEFSGQVIRVDLRRRRVAGTIRLRAGAMPQDVKLSPDGRIFYVADMMAGGLWEVSATRFRIVGFVRTGAGAHGLYPSRDARFLYVSNRIAGTVSVISFATRRVVATWRIPHGTPDMGGVSANGHVLWLSGRYSREVYAIDTANGHLLARIPVGAGPHGLSVWPQPGRHSLGHTGILR